MCYTQSKVHTEQCTESTAGGDCADRNTFSLTSVSVAVLCFLAHSVAQQSSLGHRPAQPNVCKQTRDDW